MVTTTRATRDGSDLRCLLGVQWADGILLAVDYQHRAAQPAGQLGGPVGVQHRVAEAVGQFGGDQRVRVGLQPPATASSIALVECGSVKIWLMKNSRKSR